MLFLQISKVIQGVSFYSYEYEIWIAEKLSDLESSNLRQDIPKSFNICLICYTLMCDVYLMSKSKKCKVSAFSNGKKKKRICAQFWSGVQFTLIWRDSVLHFQKLSLWYQHHIIFFLLHTHDIYGFPLINLFSIPLTVRAF